MNRRSARSTLLLVASAGLVGTVFAIERGLDTLGIAVAFKARMLCSGVFVADRAAGDVLRELEDDDPAPPRHIRTAVDYSDARVSASALGVVRRTAALRRAGGCALVPRGTPAWRFQWEALGGLGRPAA